MCTDFSCTRRMDLDMVINKAMLFPIMDLVVITVDHHLDGPIKPNTIIFQNYNLNSSNSSPY